MPARLLLARTGLVLLALTGGALAAVGGVSIGVAGLVSVVLAAVVTGCLGAGLHREGAGEQSRQAAVDVGWRTAVVTVGVLLVLSGSAVLAGGAVTALLAGCALATVLLRWAVRSRRGQQAPARASAPRPSAAREPDETATVLPLVPADGSWVRVLSVPALGREWVRTSAALARTQAPAARQELVLRRQQALDELERRDPQGFARWLAAGATVDSDPAEYVSADPAAGYDAA